MAFVDSATGGRVITGGELAGPVLLDKDCRVGDLLSPAGRDGWVPATGSGALLVAAGSAPRGATIATYRVATLDFGPGCDATPGDPLYGLADPPGGYATEGAGTIIGRMLSTSLASITPNSIGETAPITASRTVPRAAPKPD